MATKSDRLSSTFQGKDLRPRAGPALAQGAMDREGRARRHRVASNQRLAPGKHTIRLEFAYDACPEPCRGSFSDRRIPAKAGETYAAMMANRARDNDVEKVK